MGERTQQAVRGAKGRSPRSSWQAYFDDVSVVGPFYGYCTDHVFAPGVGIASKGEE